MSNVSQFLNTEKKNRVIVSGPASRLWSVPAGTTEVEVHASTYDISSYDVCTPVTFSFSSNPSD